MPAAPRTAIKRRTTSGRRHPSTPVLLLMMPKATHVPEGRVVGEFVDVPAAVSLQTGHLPSAVAFCTPAHFGQASTCALHTGHRPSDVAVCTPAHFWHTSADAFTVPSALVTEELCPLFVLHPARHRARAATSVRSDERSMWSSFRTFDGDTTSPGVQ
jgi:hypothetical protein